VLFDSWALSGGLFKVRNTIKWNCAHIANAMILKNVQAICVQNGFSCPVICTSGELMEA
jgi:hypothetical protein